VLVGLVLVMIRTEDGERQTAKTKPLTDDRRPRNAKTGPMTANRDRAGVPLSLLISHLAFTLLSVLVVRVREAGPSSGICHLDFEL